MKLFHQFQRSHQLEQRGFSHVIVPLVLVVLVALVGTFMVVAKHSDSAKLSDAASRATSKSKPRHAPGRLVIYSQQGRYTKVRITLAQSLSGKAATAADCGGVLNAQDKWTRVKTLPAKKNPATKAVTYPPLSVTCAATYGGQGYVVALGKGNTYTSTQTVDVDPNYCTMVRWNPVEATKTPIINGHCSHSENITDTPTKISPMIRVLPQLGSDKKSIKGYVEVVMYGEIATRPMCSGQVNVTITDTSPSASRLDPSSQNSYVEPLKLVGNVTNRFPYCVTVLPQRESAGMLKSGHSYMVSVDFAGNAIVNAGSASAAQAVNIP